MCFADYRVAALSYLATSYRKYFSYPEMAGCMRKKMYTSMYFTSVSGLILKCLNIFRVVIGVSFGLPGEKKLW